MDLKEFGRRLQMVREEMLRMSQTEIAWHLNMSQTMYSRLESGMAGNIHTIFKVITYLKHRNLQGHLMFQDEFDVRALVKSEAREVSGFNERERLLELMEQLKHSAKEDYENLTILRELVARRN